MTSNHTIGTIKQLIDHLKTSGIETEDIHLVARVQHLYAGEKDHHSGKRVQVFQPVATKIDFVQKSKSDAPILTVEYNGDTVPMWNKIYIDTNKFNACLRIKSDIAMPFGAEDVAGELMRGLVERHREITGQINATFEKIEPQTGIIKTPKRGQFNLEIGLERLSKFMEIDAGWTNWMLMDQNRPEARDRFEDVGYEKLKLTDLFQKNPCSKDLYMELRREFKAQGGNEFYFTDFVDYYGWFRRSEANLDASGKLNADTRSDMTRAVKAWHAVNCHERDFKKSAADWIRNQFGMHPMHQPIVKEFVDETICALSKSKSMAPKP